MFKGFSDKATNIIIQYKLFGVLILASKRPHNYLIFNLHSFIAIQVKSYDCQ